MKSHTRSSTKRTAHSRARVAPKSHIKRHAMVHKSMPKRSLHTANSITSKQNLHLSQQTTSKRSIAFISSKISSMMMYKTQPQTISTTSQSSFHTSSISLFKYNTTTQNIISKHNLNKISFLPTQKISRRGMFGGLSNALGSMMGGKKPESADGEAPKQQMNMMQAMQMMQIMQKVVKQTQNGQIDDATHKELCTYIDEMKAQSGGNLPPGQLELFEKIKNRQAVSPNELAALTGMTPEQMEQMRDLTLEMKSGKLNAMQFMMKAAQIMQPK